MSAGRRRRPAWASQATAQAGLTPAPGWLSRPRWGRIISWLAVPGVVPAVWFPQRMPLVTGLALFVLAALWLWGLRTGAFSQRRAYHAPLLGVLVSVCLASLPTFDPELALPKMLGLALGATVLVLIVDSVSTPRRFEQAMIVLALLTCGLAATGALAADWAPGKIGLLDPVFARLPSALLTGVPNTPRGGLNPNELAGALALVLPVAVTSAAATHYQMLGRGRWCLAIGAVLTSGLVLVMTQSRGGLAGAGVAVLILFGILCARLRHTGRGRLLLAGYLVIVGLAVWLVWRTTAAWVTGAAPSAGRDSFASRVEVWTQALAMLRDFPITGIGMGQFNPVLHLLYASPGIADAQFVPHAHNIYLDYLVELGIPGALASADLVGVFFWACRRAWRSQDS